MVLLGPELQPMAMSVPVVLLQPWSVLMPLPPVTFEGQKNRTLKSGVDSSLATAIRRSGPTPHWRDQGNLSPCLCSMTELTLLVGCGQAAPEGMRVKRLVLPSPCVPCSGERKEKCPPPFPASCSRCESWTSPSPTAARGRAGPASHRGSRV